MLGNKLLIITLLLLLLNFSSYSANIYYRWFMTSEDKVKLVLYIPKKLCSRLNNKNVFVFLSTNGKIYRKGFRKNYGCKIIKKFKNLQKLRVLIFSPENLEIKDLGIIDKPAEKIY